MGARTPTPAKVLLIAAVFVLALAVVGWLALPALGLIVLLASERFPGEVLIDRLRSRLGARRHVARRARRAPRRLWSVHRLLAMCGASRAPPLPV